MKMIVRVRAKHEIRCQYSKINTLKNGILIENDVLNKSVVSSG